MAPPAVGLRQNVRQFALLLAVNAFVGAMVGLERAVLPLMAAGEFGVKSYSVGLSFVASFGVAKALTNLVAGRLADARGRKPVLLAGWLVALPVPWLLFWAPSWNWIVLANALLGINQGLTWTTLLIMKLDLAGERQRGLAMGLNEFTGYLAVSLAALAGGFVADAWGLRPGPLYLGIGFVALGLGLSAACIRETASSAHERPLAAGRHASSSHSNRCLSALWRQPVLATASQAGMVNNLNDGLAWGLLPTFFAASGLRLGSVGSLAALYPFVWSILQPGMGWLSDQTGRKKLISSGMVLQGAALAGLALGRSFTPWAASLVVLGVGTAMVYPTLLATVSDAAPGECRGAAIGMYRLWRDGGYAAGGIVAGGVADLLGPAAAIGAVAILTALSGLVVAWRMPETRRGP